VNSASSNNGDENGDEARIATRALIVVLLLGLLIRLPLAWVNLRVSADMDIYFQWGQSMRTASPGTIYQVSNTVSPPLLISLLGIAAMFQPSGESPGPLFTFVVKSMSMLADVLTAGLIALYVRRYSVRLAVIACALYVLNPAVWYVSSIWGQTDSLYTLFVVASVLLLERGWFIQAWLCYSLAFATKLQSFAFAPLLIAGTLAGGVAGTMAQGGRKSYQTLFAGILAAASSFLLIALPWILTGRFGSLLRIYTTSPEARVDISAFNLWYLLFSGQTLSISSLRHPLGLFLSYQGVGLVLFGLFAVTVAGLVLLRRMSLFLAAAALGIGMFALMTEMHERHLFPALAFLLLAAFVERGDSYLLCTAKAAKATEGEVRDLPRKPVLWAYSLLSLSYLVNLVIIAPPGFLPFVSLLAPNADTLQVLLLRSTSFALALLNLGLLVWLVLSGARNSIHRV